MRESTCASCGRQVEMHLTPQTHRPYCPKCSTVQEDRPDDYADLRAF